MGCGDNGMPRLTSVSVLVSVHADSPVSSCAVPAQPRGVFWSAAGGEGWNAPPSVFSPDDERDAPYSYSTTPMKSSHMPVTDAPSTAPARAARPSFGRISRNFVLGSGRPALGLHGTERTARLAEMPPPPPAKTMPVCHAALPARKCRRRARGRWTI